MTSHGAFIFAAYGITALVMLGLIGAILREYGALRRALTKFPPRGGDGEDA